MNTNIKYLVESSLGFDIIDPDYNDHDNMVDQTLIDNMLYRYYPKTKDDLEKCIEEILNKNTKAKNLNCINVSEITDFSYLFMHEDMSGVDISDWDVSQGENFNNMFYACKHFKCDLSNWNVSNGKTFNNMFFQCTEFNSDLSNWDIKNGMQFNNMFNDCLSLNFDTSKWDKYINKVLAELMIRCRYKSIKPVIDMFNPDKKNDYGYIDTTNPFEGMFLQCLKMDNIPDWEKRAQDIIQKYKNDELLQTFQFSRFEKDFDDYNF